MIALFLRACLDLSLPGSCIDVEITGPTGPIMVQQTIRVGEAPVMVPLSFTSCMGHEGMNIARDFMAQHTTYSRPQWSFGGWVCEWGSRDKPRGGEA